MPAPSLTSKGQSLAAPGPRAKSEVCTVRCVCRSFPKKGWSANFRFSQEGKRVSVEGPTRACRDEAEADRKFAAASLDQVARSSRVDAANCAAKALRNGDGTSFVEGPGSAGHSFEPGRLRKMKQSELRSLASRTPGIMRDKKTSEGKRAHKTDEELIKELLAMKANTATRTLPASLLPRHAARKMRQACCDAQLVRKGLRRQSLTASRLRGQSLTASRLRCKSRMVSVATQAVRKTDPRRRMSPLELMGSRGTKRHHKANGCRKLRRSSSQNSLR